ncbi:hypothetical protein RND71_021888 [Anisodus tanguticus]|uniref:Uncharacterized protein n=1 Tax=Anisodus tanguticus TaxID=243964 RepID=A0AAE1RYN3_9SOLA|nr:hypothetical protein RND71_021888 [Anisodus tanguticus]
MDPIYVFPLKSTSQAYAEPGAAKPAVMPTSSVKKPQARYPTPADVWPSQILKKRPHLGQEEHVHMEYENFHLVEDLVVLPEDLNE